MKNARNSIPVLSIAVLVFVLCSGPATASEDHGDSAHWGYEAHNGPDVWGSMNPDWMLCAEGLEQSPIDLADAAPIELPEAEIHTPSDQEVELLNQAGVIGALNNGHTVQVNANIGEAMIVGDKNYTLVQFHFHAPSEHTIDGQHFPMEVHFVHQAADGALAVVGVLIEEGVHNPSIAAMWEQLPEATGVTVNVRIPARFAEHIFSRHAGGFYHYDGSLTTPPCSENVRWYIRKAPSQLAKDQIEAFLTIYDNNNRPVQRLNKRTLYFDENPHLTIQ